MGGKRGYNRRVPIAVLLKICSISSGLFFFLNLLLDYFSLGVYIILWNYHITLWFQFYWHIINSSIHSKIILTFPGFVVISSFLFLSFCFWRAFLWWLNLLSIHIWPYLFGKNNPALLENVQRISSGNLKLCKILMS